MELINYLNGHFFTKQELLDISKVSEAELRTYQEQGVMPECSYKLSIGLKSDSFFGEHNDEHIVEYYAKGSSSWLAIVQFLSTFDNVYAVFEARYIKAIEDLKKNGHSSDNAKINSAINLHIKDEWAHFLNGTYGLCTKSGLPEDIAAKEFAIIEINELCEEKQLDHEQLSKLTRAVNLLDQASSLFAPHERAKSSRHRLVDEVRRTYRLSI